MMATEEGIDTVESLAEELNQAFERRTRDQGNHEPGLDHYMALKDGSPQWMIDACHAAHRTGSGAWDVMLPDDWRYEFIEDAADALSENDGDLGRARDSLNESDHYCYTSQRTGWLHSNNARSAYVEEATEEGLADPSDLNRTLRVGMLLEQEEVLERLHEFLENLAEESEPEA